MQFIYNLKSILLIPSIFLIVEVSRKTGFCIAMHDDFVQKFCSYTSTYPVQHPINHTYAIDVVG